MARSSVAHLLHDRFCTFFLSAEILSALRVFPHLRIFERLADFNEPALFHIDVKDTSAVLTGECASPLRCLQSGSGARLP